jgi:hypothetical protein
VSKAVSSAAPRRRATRRPRRAADEPPRPSRASRALHGLGFSAWLIVVLTSAAALVAALLGHVGDWLGDAGAVATSTAYAWGFAARTGGRPVIFSMLALVLGGIVVAVDENALLSGAAVVTAVLTAVFAVMVTVPARGFVAAVRETVVALLVSAIGAMATLGWAPAVDLQRFEYTVLGLALVASFLTVYRLGAGFHGLGTRGIVTVLAGSVTLAVTVGYAELLQRYGTHSLVETLDDAVRWSHHHLGAFPRPIIALLGVPALVWGTHMRARRRQGWWVCAFGIALSAPVAYALIDPGRSVEEVSLASGYGVVIGLVIGFVLIRIDLRVSRRKKAHGRRQAEIDEVTAVRPEPGRTHALW